MDANELRTYVDAAGGVLPFKERVNITERYTYALLAGTKNMSKELDQLIRLKIRLKKGEKK